VATFYNVILLLFINISYIDHLYPYLFLYVFFFSHNATHNFVVNKSFCVTWIFMHFDIFQNMNG
jgi:hypothetical protein